MKQEYMVFDYETFSECDIKKAGAWEYSVHPSTEILCVGFRCGTKEELPNKPTLKWVPSDPSTSPAFAVFMAKLRNPSVHLVAHNALFEQVITRNVFGKKLNYSRPELQSIPLSRWSCTAAMARSTGIPGNLEGAGAAMGLKHQKDKEGHRLMLKLCKPRKATKKNAATRHTDAEEFKKLVAYCVKDVDAEVELFLKLPPMHPKVRQFWELDQRMNLRGFAVDRELVLGALHLIDVETARLDKRVQELTGGLLNSARQRDAVLKYLRKKGMSLPDLRAATVKERVERGPWPSAFARELLEIRESISRSSTAKYKAFEIRSRFDGRARDNTIFFGAHTGRQSGTGLQPQNLFKTVLRQEDVEAGLELIRRKDHFAIEAIYGKPMDLYASALRSCILSAAGHHLSVGDFATVEVRVLFWLCGEKRGLDSLAKGEPLYSDMAGSIYGEDGRKIEAGYKAQDKDCLFKRTVGKHTVLGAGFGIGLGGEKFQATCKMFGVDVTLELAQQAIRAYRERFPRVPAFWSNLEKGATLAVQNPGKRYRVGYLYWQMQGNFLTCQLPTGRKLHYFKPQLHRVATLWGDKLTLTYMSVKNGKSYRDKTWGGKLTENCVQAVAADCLMESLLRLEDAGHPPVLAVHDEAVCETPDAKVDVKGFEETMAAVPPWAEGLPIKVEGWAERRYRK